MRQLTYSEAIREATDHCLTVDPRVYVMGLGATDPSGVFGTTTGLDKKHGCDRVLDMPTSENGMTGVAIGSALVGMRPIMVHQRADFALLALDQIINNAANWHYMFGGHGHVPLVIRLIVGRGWGQGAQHSQNLQAVFAHIPGLKVATPSTPYDAKGLLIEAVADPNPVIFIEHRWLHRLQGPVPEGPYRVRLGEGRKVRAGTDLSLVSSSYMTIEAIRAADVLGRQGIGIDVIDLRCLKPWDSSLVLESVEKTGRLLVLEGAWRTAGFAAEIVSTVVEEAYHCLKAAPRRLTLPDAPVPSSPALARGYYPRAVDVVNAVLALLDLPARTADALGLSTDAPLDVPDPTFTGPF